VPLAELREASLRWAKRLSLVSPEALYGANRAVNRGADAAGFRTALYADPGLFLNHDPPRIRPPLGRNPGRVKLIESRWACAKTGAAPDG
jgi:hypothetical protein